MSDAKLELSINTYLAPKLKCEGFKGSGRTFRRTINDVFQVLHIQKSRNGDQFCIEYAIHPTFIPDALGNEINTKKSSVYDCELRKRLTETGTDFWWNFKQDQKSMDKAVQNATEMVESVFFKDLSKYQSVAQAFGNVAMNDINNKPSILRNFMITDARLALILSKIRMHENRKLEALEFAKIGIELSGTGALLLKGEFEEIIEKIQEEK